MRILDIIIRGIGATERVIKHGSGGSIFYNDGDC